MKFRKLYNAGDKRSAQERTGRTKKLIRQYFRKGKDGEITTVKSHLHTYPKKDEIDEKKIREHKQQDEGIFAKDKNEAQKELACVLA